MRIIVWGINYAPELTGIAPYNVMLCEFLRRHGHQVEMVTTFPYYPGWRKHAGDRGKLFRTDVINNVRVHRCWHYVPEKVSALKRIVHEGSWVLMSFVRTLALGKADVMVVVSPPLLLGAAAWAVGLIKRVPFVFHVQDLQPDAAVGLGMLKRGWLTRMLYHLESLAYRKAARVSGISRGMLDAFRQKAVQESKQVYFPNPVILSAIEELPAAGRFRGRHGFTSDDFLAVYSGNLGVKQGLGVLIEAASNLADRIKIVICGDGADRERLSGMVAAANLTNVLLLPLQTNSEYGELLRDADVCVITQQAGSGHAFFPSKLLTSLASGKPVLSVSDMDSELAMAAADGGFGINVLPGKPIELARALESAADNAPLLQEMGRRGREYVARFESERVLSEFEKVLVGSRK